MTEASNELMTGLGVHFLNCLGSRYRASSLYIGPSFSLYYAQDSRFQGIRINFLIRDLLVMTRVFRNVRQIARSLNSCGHGNWCVARQHSMSREDASQS